MSEGVEPMSFATAMASSLALDFEEIESFGEFVDSTSFNEINGKLEDAEARVRILTESEDGSVTDEPFNKINET